MQFADMDQHIAALEHARRSRPGPKATLALLAGLDNAAVTDGAQLARLHDSLLFLRAYPENAQILKRTDSLLKRFRMRVASLDRTVDLSSLLEPEVSGIAGTSVTTTFSHDFVRWLARRFAGQVSIDWDAYESPEKLATVLPRFLPFLEEESSADANVPYLDRLRDSGATARDGGLGWLLRNLDAAPLTPDYRAALYDGLGIWIRWMLGNSPMTRTLMRRPAEEVFYQKEPLLSRRQVALEREIESPDLPVTRLSSREGEAVLDQARAAIAVRYRELYGFTYGDPGAVLSARGGRGLEIIVCGILPEKRLPLRAGFSTIVFRNGVPIGYGDAYGLCERLEVSFNVFYAFRDGESAFCFARLMKLYHQIFGSRTFSIEPYQIGYGNEEAIASGAFWFYRKLGFRSPDPVVERLAEREQTRIARESGYRTSARVLKRMAISPMIFEAPGAAVGAWDRFEVGNLDVAVRRAMGKRAVEASAFCQASKARVSATLSLRLEDLSLLERHAFEKLAPILDLIPDLGSWSSAERETLIDIIQAKAGRREETCLRLLARHTRLRGALLKLGKKRGI